MRREFAFLAGATPDVCVIGAGPAGITVALELARAGRNVLLLEGGEDGWTAESQDIYLGETFGDPYLTLDGSRLRQLGGSTGHWQGMSRLMEEVDFVPKEAHSAAHWPIRKADLDPYIARTAEILEVSLAPLEEVVDAEIGIKRLEFETSPVQFAEKYRDTLDTEAGLDVVLRANVTRLETNGRAVTGAVVEDYDGNAVTVTAGRYIVATGGIENSRLLLWSDAQANGALLHHGAPTGRYWMEHPHFTIGSALVTEDYLRYSYYALTRERQEVEGILGCAVRLQPVNYSGTKKMVADLACVAPRAAEWISGLVDMNLACGARMRAASEQEPHPDNRVALSRSGRDRFGVPHSELHWRKTARDIDTVRRTAFAFGEHLARRDIGRLKVDDWVELGIDDPEGDELGGNHHMGGTRMADNPYAGVVDADCKVWGQANLYVAGSSVFPSAGHANPTATIIQLALRLADHLNAG